MIELKLV